jgi:hypothetical protein
MKRLIASLLMLSAAACTTDEKSGGTDGATSDASTTLSSEDAEACACLADASCGAAQCEAVLASCEGCDEGPDEAAVECSLVALRDRTPGMIAWVRRSQAGEEFTRNRVYIRADGPAVLERYNAQDLCTRTGPHALVTLESPAYYEGCLAKATLAERISCLTQGLGEETAECTPSVEECAGL